MANDVRLIDANALKKSLRESHDELMRMRNNMPYGEERKIADAQLTTFSECIMRLKEQPTIDPESLWPAWIPVTDRLPERTMPPHDVLVYHDLKIGMFVDRAWYSYDTNKWRSVLGMNLKVTHWMPLPRPPKGE